MGSNTSSIRRDSSPAALPEMSDIPQVVEIKFLDKPMVGFPIVPVVLEGVNGFSPEKSIYSWEFAKPLPAEEEPISSETVVKMSQSDWANCKVIGNPQYPVFIPDETHVGCILRITCLPSNATRTRVGPRFSAETAVVINPPISKFLFQERIDRLRKKPEDLNFFRVISYNILAEKLASPEKFVDSPKESLRIERRLPILNFEIKSYQPDIVCLQEVDEKYFKTFYGPFLSESGLDRIHCSKPSVSNIIIEGETIFFNRSKFDLMEWHFNRIYDFMRTLPFHEQISAKPNLLEHVASRNQVVLIAVLKPKCSLDTIVVVASTHLYSKATAPGIKLLQAITCTKFIESKLEELKARFPEKKFAVLFCGDFNSVPDSGAAKFLTTGKIGRNETNWASTPIEGEQLSPGIDAEHQLKFTNTHPDHELTTIIHDFEGCIDYMWYQADSFQILEKYPPPSKEKIKEFCEDNTSNCHHFPNLHAASDHLPLIVDFQLKHSS